MDNNKKLAIVAGGIISSYILINYFDYFKLKHRIFNSIWVYLGPKIDSNLCLIKKELFSEAHGNVLDVGSGNGVTLKYLNFNNGNIKSITAVEPNEFMLPALKENVDNFKLSSNINKNNINIIPKTIEDAILDGELELESFDTIICNLVLCSIPNQKKVLIDIQSLLKPGGKFLFIEHVVSDSIFYKGLEYLLNPLWSTVFDGCHLTKKTDFDIKSMNGWSSITISQITQPPKFFKHISGPIVDKKLYSLKKRLFSKEAYGRVLDIGSGDGVTFKYLIDCENIKSITGVEPNEFMQSKLRENANKSIKLSNDKIKINIISKTIENAILDGELELESFDTIICNLVLCSIPNQKRVLIDIQSLLKPGGKFIFIEHVISESTIGSTFQHLINPIWGIIGDGCQLTHKTDQTIKSMNGWELVEVNKINNKSQSLKHVYGYAIKK